MNGKTVLVAWDFSAGAEAALNFAFKQFEPKNIQVLCVLERPSLYAFGVDFAPTAEKDAESRCLDSFTKEVGKAVSTQVQFSTEFGEPASQILSYASRNHVSLIVMSTHGRTGLTRLMMGSVAQQVLAHAECPVVVLPMHFVRESNGLKTQPESIAN